jgi:A/G-specific adenine glycosylase
VNAEPIGLSVSLPDARWRKAFRRRLRGWYGEHARDLPWRRTRNPYRVWVSEVMLQQTQVATVKAYFERFLRAFPTIKALARADQGEVLRLWEGLGYYRRATQLHRAAQILIEQHGGEFPRDPQIVRSLPGIGRYTAGAILSIAFGHPQPILEANTSRLLSRLLAFGGNPASADGRRLLWTVAEMLLPRRDVGTFNQALMELGSEVCLARQPQCRRCPVANLCRTRSQGLQQAIPAAMRRWPPTPVHEAAVLIRRRGRVLLVKCPQGQRWAGLWDFPRFEIHSQCPAALRRELADNIRKRTGLIVDLGGHLKTIKHSVTRFRITLDCYQAEYLSGRDGEPTDSEIKWLPPRALGDYPLAQETSPF